MRMRTTRITAAVAMSAALVALSIAPAVAQGGTSYTAKGLEVSATSTEGQFIGTISGKPAGTWYADVVHTPLSPGAAITGGSFTVALDKTAPVRVLTGALTGGTITSLSSDNARCTDQAFAVDGTVRQANGALGSIDVTLVHHRLKLGQKCVVYAATVTGALAL
jgi:hypothetical protein